MLCASSDHEQLAAICDQRRAFWRGRAVAELEGDAISKAAIAELCYTSLGDSTGARLTTISTAEQDKSRAEPSAHARRWIDRGERYGLVVAWLVVIALFGFAAARHVPRPGRISRPSSARRRCW